jgi:hypothetical protein
MVGSASMIFVTVAIMAYIPQPKKNQQVDWKHLGSNFINSRQSTVEKRSSYVPFISVNNITKCNDHIYRCLSCRNIHLSTVSTLKNHEILN